MIEDYFFTKNTKWVLWGAFAILVVLLIFHAGVVIGQQQAIRGRTPFADTRVPGALEGIMPRQGYVEKGHGAVGTVATVTLPTFSMQTRDGMSQMVETGSSTDITGGSSGTLQDLRTGEMVIVIGDPQDTDDGYLDARIIHILSAPPAH